MGEIKIFTFKDALEKCEELDRKYKKDRNHKNPEPGKPHLLLGNGFSMAWNSSVFHYGSLYEKAASLNLPTEVRQVFKKFNTFDFEKVIRILRQSSHALCAYGVTGSTSDLMMEHAELLKEVLIKVITDNHPVSPACILPDQYTACEAFLGNFASVYTLNYDLLLYWTVMDRAMRIDDGFRAPEVGFDGTPLEEYVTWDIWGRNKAKMHFLHGALHLFDSPAAVKKLTWSRTGVPLIDQIQRAFNEGLFPIFVAEGESREKIGKIRHNDYLSRAYRSFANIGNSLFIYGHSLAGNDAHILNLIARGNLRNLFIGLYDDPDNSENLQIRRRAEIIENARTSSQNPLAVHFYDSASAQVWG